MLCFLFCLLAFSYVYGGSKCPDRADIYPCICINQVIGKNKYQTTLVCQGLVNGESLKLIEPGLSSMDIDTFLLYDSYWSVHPRLLQGNARIPVNYGSSFRMTDVKVVDTVLSSFACPQRDNCKTSYLKRFTAINSTVSENPACSNHSSINTWISCPENVEFILLDGCYKTSFSLKPEFFPDRLSKLKALHMRNNQITKVERRTFNHVRFPALETLDLSHNSLREVRILISSALKVKHLDLSYNSIRSVLDFQYLPNLRLLNLTNNHILSLLENEWENIPKNLRIIDLTNNVLDCNCATKWVNSTFHISTHLLGHCASPPEVASMKIRRASRLLNERCNESGQIAPAKIKATTTTRPS